MKILPARPLTGVRTPRKILYMNINPGTEVIKSDERGVVCSVNQKTGMLEVMWIGGSYPVREDPSDVRGV